MSKINIFEIKFFEKIFKNNLKKLKHKKCCGCGRKIEDIKLISNCYYCKKNYCFICCNKLFFENYFILPKGNVNDLILVLFHAIDRHYFSEMCCSKNYYLNFIPNKFNMLSYYNRYEDIHRELINQNITNFRKFTEIEDGHKLKLSILYKHTNKIFWNTYILIKINIPLDIIFLILKYNIPYITFNY